jgi:crotonobetainyl-CoA:carnitine CoA-transferase CaiB-like acyl-CoA transferase
MLTPFEEVMSIRSLTSPEPEEVEIIGSEPILSTKFRIGTTAAAVLAGIGVATNDIWEMKTGRRQKVKINMRHTAAALRSSNYLQRPDGSGGWENCVNRAHEDMIAITQPWPTKDGRWFLPHFGLPHLQKRVLNLLGAEPNPKSVAAAVSRHDAIELEQAIDEIRACGAMVRSNEEWLATEHGKVLAGKPIVEIIKIGDSEPEPLPDGPRPLSGIRALDLTRILAGPISARSLAEHGADVLMVTAPHLPQIAEHVIDTSHGKRSCFLDLRDDKDAEKLKFLASNADIFTQGYRPGIIASHGFAPDDLATIRPGIIYVSISCFGADGPFSHRAGWEQVAQTVTGIAQEGSPERPKLLPAAANDYTTGYLAAYGVLLALARRAKDGGSYHVRVSLCQSGMFIYRQGNVKFSEPNYDFPTSELDNYRCESKLAAGPIRHLAPVLQMSETHPFCERPSPTLGGNFAEWQTR